MKVIEDFINWVVMITMIVIAVYVLLLSVEGEYEVNQERQKIYFDSVKESNYEK